MTQQHLSHTCCVEVLNQIIVLHLTLAVWRQQEAGSHITEQTAAALPGDDKQDNYNINTHTHTTDRNTRPRLTTQTEVLYIMVSVAAPVQQNNGHESY